MVNDIDNKDHSYTPTGNGGYKLFYKKIPSDGEKVCWMLAERDKMIQSLQAENERLKEALKDISLAPFPLHDYCSKENWELACKLVHESYNTGDGTEEAIALLNRILNESTTE